MTSVSGNWIIVFNGEIYNFLEIKNQLNYNFKTKSDTEVILAAIEVKGIKWFLEKANGMFAIALYNSQYKKLFLLRDRLGIKPLFYFYDNEKIIFSSEIKGILSSGLVDAEFNELAVDEYLANRYVREPYSFFRNIFQIEAGSFIEIDNSITLKKYKYWNLPEDFNFNKSFDENRLASKFEDEIIKSINYRLCSDVPLGTYLSSGVDSSLITAITSDLTKEIFNTYTIGFPELNELNIQEIFQKI